MMKFTFTILLLLLVFTSESQVYSKCKIHTDELGLERLTQLGIPVDHGIKKQNTFFIGDFSKQEIELMKQQQFQVEVLIEDVGQFYRDRSKEEKTIYRNTNCPVQEGFTPEVPSNFNLGSMAGYYTYQEFLDELDQMATLYPNLITIKAPISSYLTHESRPIYWVKISDQANVDEAEPEVLYSAIHHAREPASLSQTIFYMWYLLENYAGNPEIQYLVNETELYFVPMLNPDGYIQNQTSDPNGGGMWRKNKCDNGDGTFGVDLNRNYSHDWGTTGISFDPSSDVYPGTGAFSEPETQAMKWFCENRDFQFAFNAHTYGNLILFPIGSISDEFAADHDYFQNITSHMAQYSQFVAQKSSDLYPASGDSDDYMYLDDLGIKPEIFAFTPEIGSDSDGFWPAQSEIVAICQSMVFTNLVLAHAVHNYWQIHETDANALASSSGFFNHTVQRLGLETASLTVSIEALSGIQSVGSPIVYNLALNASQAGSISYQLTPGILIGTEVKYVLISDNGSLIQRDTIVKVFGNPPLQISDDASTTINWTGDWNTTTEDFVSPSTSFTDSPFGQYSNFSATTYTYNNSISLTSSTDAKVQFNAKWDVENNFDYARLEVSIDGGTTWIGQCGKYTNTGTSANGSVQPDGEPVYDGLQLDWVLEEISLTDYLGEIIQIRFVLAADGGVKGDGFYVDDFKIFGDGNIGLTETNQSFLKVFPVPSSGNVLLSFPSAFNRCQLIITDQQGKVMVEKNIQESGNTYTLGLENLDNGIYHLQLEDENQKMHYTKIVIAH